MRTLAVQRNGKVAASAKAALGELVSVALTWGVSKLTQPLPEEHVRRLFDSPTAEESAA